MKKEREVTFDDINPLDYTVDRLTTIDEMKKELEEFNRKKSEWEERRKKAEAEKREDVLKKKLREDLKAEASKKDEEKNSSD